MKTHKFIRNFAQIILCFAAGICSTSCIDENYDFSQDIDLTMGLGAEGLALKLGSTEKIYLSEIIETDENVKTDRNSVYYLVEEGKTGTDFHINEVSASFDAATLSTHQRIVNFEDVLAELGVSNVVSVPVSKDFRINNHGAGETDHFEFTLKNVQKEVEKVSKVYPKDGTHIRLQLKIIEPEGLGFYIEKVENLKIVMPEYLVIKELELGTFEGNVITIPELLHPDEGSFCDITVDYLDLGEDGIINENRELSLPKEKNVIKMSGDFTFASSRDFVMNLSDYIDAELNISITSDQGRSNSYVEVEKIVGKFNPHINPITEKIELANNLPDFLKGEEVRIHVANPTVKFDADLTNIPLDLKFAGEITAHMYDDPAYVKTVKIPTEDKEIFLLGGQHDLIYFYQIDNPYDPTVEGMPAGDWYKIPNLSSLIERIPDYVQVDVADGQIHVDQSKEYAVQLGKDYHADLEYNIYVPLEVENGLCIVYRDSTESFGSDLEDFQAHGLQVTGVVASTIPLSILAEATPVDKAGEPIPGIIVDPISIPATDGLIEKQSQITLDITLSDPALLQKVDKLKFSFKAEAPNDDQTHALTSKQYLQIKEMRLKLKGQVIGNFN